jgi:hypothetical protein
MFFCSLCEVQVYFLWLVFVYVFLYTLY